MKPLAIAALRLGALVAAAALTIAVLPSAAQAASAPNPCAFPTAPSATLEETAWRLFVAANCPANSGKVVWENWVEQSQLYPAVSGATAQLSETLPRRLHGSPLAMVLAKKGRNARLTLVPSAECNAMNGPPKNVIAGATICEEAHLNPEAAAFVTQAGYQVRPGQTAAAQKGVDIEFPKDAIEVKVDWVPATDFAPAFTCAKPPPGVHVESVDGVCYAMAGIHISSKLLTNWVWATFEPQSMLTNPLRCITFVPCHDRWGSTPAVSSGGPTGFTHQTSAVHALMKQAGLAAEFFNYRLDGVQVNFTGPGGKPTYLGNSVIEGENVGMTHNTASCITCHSVSSIKTDGTDGASLLSTATTVGPKYSLPAQFVARDFVWSMGLACPDAGLRACPPAAHAQAAAPKTPHPAQKG